MQPQNRAASPPVSGTPDRPWIGVKFLCSGKYVRVNRHVNGRGYLARCPECSRCVRFRVDPGGCEQRFFEVSC